MAKTITKRDLVVIRVISDLIPGVAGITIIRYTVNDPEYKVAHIEVPAIKGEIWIRLRHERLRNGWVGWIPVWIAVPDNHGDHVSGEIYNIYEGPGGEYRFLRRS